MGIIKIRGMMYPYTLMYKNRNNTQQLEDVISEIQRDIPLIEEIYGKKFAEKIQNPDFLKNVQSSVKPYNNVLEFAEGMSRELLGIEQVKKLENTLQEDRENQEQNSEYLVTTSTIEHDTQGIGLQEINNVVQEIKQIQKQKAERKGQISK